MAIACGALAHHEVGVWSSFAMVSAEALSRLAEQFAHKSRIPPSRAGDEHIAFVGVLGGARGSAKGIGLMELSCHASLRGRAKILAACGKPRDSRVISPFFPS